MGLLISPIFSLLMVIFTEVANVTFGNRPVEPNDVITSYYDVASGSFVSLFYQDDHLIS